MTDAPLQMTAAAKRESKPRAMTPEIDRIITQTKQIIADLIALRQEVKDSLPDSYPFERDIVVEQRLFLLSEQGHVLVERLRGLSNCTRRKGVADGL